MRKTIASQISKIHAPEKVRHLVVGGSGQVGQSVTPSLCQLFGAENVFLSDLRVPEGKVEPKFIQGDALDIKFYEKLVQETRPKVLYHLPALMSGSGERDPERCVHLNNTSFAYALKIANDFKLQLYVPSTIAAFGFLPEENRDVIPNNCFQRPQSIYGVTKVYMELLGEYHHRRYGLDFRSLRYPGIVSPIKAFGGTTDYLTDMIEAAVKGEEYVCYLEPHASLPFIHSNDCIALTVG